MISIRRELCPAYKSLVRRAKRLSRATGSPDQALLEFRKAQREMIDLIRSPDVTKLIDEAVASLRHLRPQDDVSQFLADFLTEDNFDKEVKISCFSGLKRKDVEELIGDIRRGAGAHPVVMPKLDSNFIAAELDKKCNFFVKMVSISRAYEKKRKKKAKKAAIKMFSVSVFGAICALVNAPLAIPSIGIVPTISFGITASSAVLALQYAHEMSEQ